MRRHFDDPSLPAIAMSAAGVLTGFLGLVLAWVGASRQLFAGLVTPWIASGALGGLAIAGLSTAVLAIHLRRRRVAVELALLDEARGIAEELRP